MGLTGRALRANNSAFGPSIWIWRLGVREETETLRRKLWSDVALATSASQFVDVRPIQLSRWSFMLCHAGELLVLCVACVLAFRRLKHDLHGTCQELDHEAQQLQGTTLKWINTFRLSPFSPEL